MIKCQCWFDNLIIIWMEAEFERFDDRRFENYDGNFKIENTKELQEKCRFRVAGLFVIKIK